MPIWIALPFLVAELLVTVALGYLLLRFWFYALFTITVLALELTLLTSAIHIWRETFILLAVT